MAAADSAARGQPVPGDRYRERRARGDRRRNACGLLEVRARRAGVDGDRRRRSRNGAPARERLLALLRGRCFRG